MWSMEHHNNELRSSRLFIECDSYDVRNHLRDHIFNVETFASRCKHHQSGYPCMYKRILERLGERRHKDFYFGVVTQSGPQPANENAHICSYGHLGVALKACEMPEKITVENAITELLAQMLSAARAGIKLQNAPLAKEEQSHVSLLCGLQELYP